MSELNAVDYMDLMTTFSIQEHHFHLTSFHGNLRIFILNELFVMIVTEKEKVL